MLPSYGRKVLKNIKIRRLYPSCKKMNSYGGKLVIFFSRRADVCSFVEIASLPDLKVVKLVMILGNKLTLKSLPTSVFIIK